MTEFTQPVAAANGEASLDAAADAFKSFLGQTPADPQDGQLRDAPSEDEDEIAVEAPDDGAQAASDGEQADAEEAAEEAQPDAHPLPLSWSKDDSALWSSLPAEAQATIARREAQRDAAVGQKFQEAAAVRRANEGLVAEANANRTRYADAVDQVLSLVRPKRPDPKDFVTEQGFDQASYAIAQHGYQQTIEGLGALSQQRQQIAAQQAQDAAEAEAQALAQINQMAAPRFVADVPDLADPAKGQDVIGSVVRYAIEQGIPADYFSPDNMRRVSLAELHLAWKAQRYDAMKAAQAKVAASPKPQAKKASPAIRPGVATPRAAADRAKFSGAMDRLAQSGSIEDGAAVLKHLFKGR